MKSWKNVFGKGIAVSMIKYSFDRDG